MIQNDKLPHSYIYIKDKHQYNSYLNFLAYNSCLNLEAGHLLQKSSKDPMAAIFNPRIAYDSTFPVFNLLPEIYTPIAVGVLSFLPPHLLSRRVLHPQMYYTGVSSPQDKNLLPKLDQLWNLKNIIFSTYLHINNPFWPGI